MPAAHVRQQVLDAAIAALKAGVPGVRGRVGEDLGDEIDASTGAATTTGTRAAQGAGGLPAIVVRADQERIFTKHGHKQRLLRLTCIATVAEGARLQTALNDLAADIEATLDGGLIVDGKRIALEHPDGAQAPGIELDYSGRLETKTAALAVTYFAVYLTARGQPRQLT